MTTLGTCSAHLGDGFGGFAFDVGGFVGVEDVLLRSLIDSTVEFATRRSGNFLVTTFDGSKCFLAECLDTRFESRVALRADDSLTRAFESRFVVGHVEEGWFATLERVGG